MTKTNMRSDLKLAEALHATRSSTLRACPTVVVAMMCVTFFVIGCSTTNCGLSDGLCGPMSFCRDDYEQKCDPETCLPPQPACCDDFRAKCSPGFDFCCRYFGCDDYCKKPCPDLCLHCLRMVPADDGEGCSN